MFWKKRSRLMIEINDYIIRILNQKGEEWIAHEKYLPPGLVEEGVIVNEMDVFQLVKDQITLIGGKKHHVRTFVPDAYVLLKTIKHPPELSKSEIKEYVQMELGQSIHLPFEQPIIDVDDPVEGDGEATLYAAQAEEVEKLVHLLMDADCEPEAVDVRALCNVRLLHEMNRMEKNKTYMITNWSLHELSVCIYSNNQVEFLRYETIATDLTQWQANQNGMDDVHFTYTGNEEQYHMQLFDHTLELERIMNFFRFSLHRGERTIDEIIVMGDHPFLEQIREMIATNIPLPTQIVNDLSIQDLYPNVKAKHAALIGLSMKEV